PSNGDERRRIDVNVRQRLRPRDRGVTWPRYPARYVGKAIRNRRIHSRRRRGDRRLRGAPPGGSALMTGELDARVLPHAGPIEPSAPAAGRGFVQLEKVDRRTAAVRVFSSSPLKLLTA